jgi:hypothetical protein
MAALRRQFAWITSGRIIGPDGRDVPRALPAKGLALHPELCARSLGNTDGGRST